MWVLLLVAVLLALGVWALLAFTSAFISVVGIAAIAAAVVVAGFGIVAVVEAIRHERRY